MILDPIKNLPDVSFVNNASLEEILSEMITDYEVRYEELTGKKIILSKSDPNRLILYSCALQIYQSLQYIDRAGKQDLIKYSYEEYLDNLAALRGLERNKAKAATVTVCFTIQSVRTSVVIIPAGTRVATGEIYFESVETGEISQGETSVDIKMICMQDGEIGNGFIPGEIKTLVDQIAYIESVTNTTESSGGSDVESDENFAERIYLAPSGYSTAGSEEAYIYWAKTYNQSVADVKVDRPSAGVVDIRFNLENGRLPDEEMIYGMIEFMSGEAIRPLTDNVTAGAPDIEGYEIEVKYWIDKKDSGQANMIVSKVEQAVEEYKVWQNGTIGRDIDPSELNKRMREAGAKGIEVIQPVYTEISDISIAQLTSKKVDYGGIK